MALFLVPVLVTACLTTPPANAQDRRPIRDSVIDSVSGRRIGGARVADLVVTAGTYDAFRTGTTTIGQLSRDQILARPQLGNDLFRAIGRLPGIAASDGTAAFSVRGARPDQVLIRLDGFDLVEPYHLKDLDAALSVIDIRAIGRMSIHGGGYTVEHGDRQGAVIEMSSSRSGAPRSYELGATVSTLSARAERLSGSGRAAAFAQGRRGYLDVVLRLIGESRRISPGYWDGFGGVDLDLGHGHRLDLRTLVTRDRLSYQERGGPKFSSSYQISYGWTRWEFGGPGTGGEVVAGLARVEWRRNADGGYPDGNRVRLADMRDLTRGQVRADLRWSIGPRLLAKGGFGVESDRPRYDYFRAKDFAIAAGDSVERSRETVQLSGGRPETIVAGYGAVRFQPFAPVTVEVGARADASAGAEAIVDPRVHTAWALGRRATLRFSIGRYHQRQRIETLAVMDGDTIPAPPERAVTAAVGFELGGSRIGFRAEAYRRVERPLRPWYVSRSPALELYPEFQSDRIRIAPSSGRALGVELSVLGRWGRNQWAIQYGVAGHRLVVGGSPIPAPRDQRHTVSVDWSRPLSQSVALNAAWYWHTGWPYSEPIAHIVRRGDGTTSLFTEYGPLNGARLPSYHRADVRLTRSTRLWSGRLEAFLEIFNLYGRSNLEGRQLEAPGGAVRTVPDNQLPFLPTLGVLWSRSVR